MKGRHNISQKLGEKRFIFVLLPAKIGLKKIQRSMVTNSSHLLHLVYANGNLPSSSFFVRVYIFFAVFFLTSCQSLDKKHHTIPKNRVITREFNLILFNFYSGSQIKW